MSNIDLSKSGKRCPKCKTWSEDGHLHKLDCLIMNPCGPDDNPQPRPQPKTEKVTRGDGIIRVLTKLYDDGGEFRHKE